MVRLDAASDEEDWSDDEFDDADFADVQIAEQTVFAPIKQPNY